MGTKLTQLLQEKRADILEKWENSVLSCYGPDAMRIFKTQQNQFANPIGHKTRLGLAELYDVLCDPSEEAVYTPDLQEYIKVKAVQKVSASDAVSFVFKLRELVREQLGKKGMTESYKEWLAFDARIDAAALAIFDMFVNSREQVYLVRINEFKQNRYLLTDGTICPSKLMRKDKELLNAIADPGEISTQGNGAGCGLPAGKSAG